jgi:hypothetical protein
MDPHNADEFEGFDRRAGGAAAGPGGPDAGIPPKGRDPERPPAKGPGFDGRPPAAPPGMGEGDNLNPELNYPEYCLIRLIDIRIDPGKTYKYRIQVKMANPNINKPNVASQSYATDKQPLVSDWFEIKQLVTVPPEYYVYAVDQQELDGKKYEGKNKGAQYLPDRQAVFQIHKWLDDPSLDERTFFPVGEWSVAERVFAYRGEYVGRKQRVEVAYWRPTQESYVMATDDKKQKGLVVDFSPPPRGSEPMILVDFEGGKTEYSRHKDAAKKDDKSEPPAKADAPKATVTDQAGYEALILTPDGRLLAHDSWTDRADEERVKRLKAWHDRIKEVKEGGKDGGGGIFGPGGQPKDKPERPGGS